MVTFEHVSKRFPRKNGELNLSDLTFSIGDGETAGILGRNGSGKRPILKLILGAAEPDSGRIWVMGKYPGFAVRLPTAMRRAERGELGVLLPRPQAESETVRNTLSVRFKELDSAFGAFIGSAYRKLRIEELEKSDMRFLSGGERTRVDFFKAIMNCPRLLLLYEPAVGLDAVMKESVCAVIRELNAQFGTTVIVVSQSLAVIEKLCGRVLVLDEGKAVYFGGCEELKKRYAAVNRVAFTLRSGYPDLQDLPVKGIYSQGQRFEAEYDEAVVTRMEIINRVLATCEASRVEVSEPDTDAVIRNIYLKRHKGKDDCY